MVSFYYSVLFLLLFRINIAAYGISNDSSTVSDSQGVYQLEEMLVNDTRINAVNPSAKILTSEDFKGKFRDLGSLLGSVSGMTVHSTGGLGAYSNVRIRGCAANQVQIYLDGVPLNAANGGAVDIGKISLGSIQKIVIHKSTAPLQLIGSNAGGIIELWSKPGETSDITNASGEIGSYGYCKAGALINHSVNNFKHWFSAEYIHSENDFLYDWDLTSYKDGDEVEKKMDNQSFTNASGQYGIIYKTPDRRSRITSHFSFNHSENGIFRISTPDINDGFCRNRSISGLVNWHYYLGNKTDLDLELTGKSEKQLIQRKEKFYIGNAFKRESSFPYAGISVTIVQAFTDWMNIKAVIGSEFESYTANDLWSSDRREPYSRRISGKFGMEMAVDNFNRFSGSIKGLLKYVQDSTNGISLSLVNKIQEPSKKSEYYPSLEALLSYNPIEPLHFFTSFNYRSRSPGFSEKFGTNENSHGNERLKSEKRAEYDAGAVWKTKRMRMSITGYANRITDKIIFIGNSQGVFVPRNLCKVRGVGLENEFDVSLFSCFTLSNMLTLMKNVIYSNEYPSWNKKYEPYLPVIQEHCSIDLRLWKVNFRHTMTISGSYYTGADNINSDFFKPVPELGFILSIMPINSITVSYRLDNYLKDKLYESEEEGKSVEHAQIYYGNPKPGRMHTVSLMLTF